MQWNGMKLKFIFQIEKDPIRVLSQYGIYCDQFNLHEPFHLV